MKCPICNDSLVPVKLSPGTVTHEHQTGCAFVWNDLTGPQIEVLQRAALGAAVRRIPEGAMLWHSEDTWYLHPKDTPAAPMGQGDTPEAALIVAGLMKGEGKC